MAAPCAVLALAVHGDGAGAARGDAVLKRPQRGLDQRGAQNGVHGREQRARALGGKYRIGVQRLVHIAAEHEAHAGLPRHVVHVALAQLGDQALVGGARQ